MPKSEAVGRPPKSPAVAKSTTAPKPKPSPSSALPSGRPAKPTPKPGATKVSLPPAGPKTKKQAEVAARNVDEARQRALAAQEARKAGSGISHKSESTVTGSNTSIKRTVRIRRNGGIGGGNIGGGGGLMNWKIK